MIFRIFCEKAGVHYHCTVSSSPHRDQTFAQLGRIVMDERDYKAISQVFKEVDAPHLQGSPRFTLLELETP